MHPKTSTGTRPLSRAEVPKTMAPLAAPFRRMLFVLCLALPLPLLVPPALKAEEIRYPLVRDIPPPASLTLCNEPIPLEDRGVWEMLDRELTIAVWDRAQVFMWLKRAGRYFPYIEEKLAEAGLPEALKYLAVAESALLNHVRSPVGALGSWQFMAETGRRSGLRADRSIDERRDFEQSTAAALRHLRELKESLGTWALAMAAYNCGEGRVKGALKEQRAKDYYQLDLPLETERYVFRIAAIKLILEDPKRYGYDLPEDRVYRPLSCDSVPVRVGAAIPISDMAEALDTQYKTLKELNPSILGPYLPRGRYMFKVPAGQGPRVKAVLKQRSPRAARGSHKASGDHYLVQRGDTLSLVSAKTGVPVSTLKALNGIEGSLIKVGQKLRLSP